MKLTRQGALIEAIGEHWKRSELFQSLSDNEIKSATTATSELVQGIQAGVGTTDKFYDYTIVSGHSIDPSDAFLLADLEKQIRLHPSEFALAIKAELHSDSRMDTALDTIWLTKLTGDEMRIDINSPACEFPTTEYVRTKFFTDAAVITPEPLAFSIKSLSANGLYLPLLNGKNRMMFRAEEIIAKQVTKHHSQFMRLDIRIGNAAIEGWLQNQRSSYRERVIRMHKAFEPGVNEEVFVK